MLFILFHEIERYVHHDIQKNTYSTDEYMKARVEAAGAGTVLKKEIAAILLRAILDGKRQLTG